MPGVVPRSSPRLPAAQNACWPPLVVEFVGALMTHALELVPE
jgi:hypothetical protein